MIELAGKKFERDASGCWSASGSDLHWIGFLVAALDRIEALQATLDSLPKDATGAPLRPGKRYWWTGLGDIRTGRYTIVEDYIPARIWDPEAGDYHLTKEAAERWRA